MAALPSGVLGLVECWAFCRLDFWFFSETIIWNLPSDGENIWDLRDASGNYFVRQICQRALTLGPGETALVRYLWKSPGEPAPYVKLVCVKYYKPWDWVIGIGLPEKEATEARDAIQGVASRSAWILGVLMVLAGGGSAASWLLISRSLMGKIDPVVEELREAAAQVTGAAGQVSQNSEALAQEANERAIAPDFSPYPWYYRAACSIDGRHGVRCRRGGRVQRLHAVGPRTRALTGSGNRSSFVGLRRYPLHTRRKRHIAPATLLPGDFGHLWNAHISHGFVPADSGDSRWRKRIGIPDRLALGNTAFRASYLAERSGCGILARFRSGPCTWHGGRLGLQESEAGQVLHSGPAS